MSGRLVLVLVACIALLVAAGEARAALRLEPCGTTPGLECGQIDVPLDRSGRIPGSISLHVERLPAVGFERGVGFLIAGGPGQGSAHSFGLGQPGSAEFFRFLMPGYTLVAFDNRGTGASGLLSCPRFQAATTLSAEAGAPLAAECAAALGPRRQFYATRDHVEDLEAVRRALGIGRATLLGVSYGTKLALAYALAHPDAVERLVLDSPVPPELPDPYGANVLRELPGTLARYCAYGACRAAAPDFAADVVTLANRLQARPVRGVVLAPGGRRVTRRMNGEDLLGIVIQADLSPGLAAELPAAVRAARAGYTRPLLRLVDLTARTSLTRASDLSAALYAATTCADGRFPWAPETPVAERQRLIDAAVAALPPGSLGPFGSWAARTGSAVVCKLWPSPAGNTPLGRGPLPDVPVLVVSGGFDLRTPTASAVAVARLFPRGSLLLVPGVGHSVLTSDLSFCSQQAVRTWLVGGPAPSACPRVASIMQAVRAFPRRPRGAGAASTLSVVAQTIREAEATWLQVSTAPARLLPAGLYGGRLVPAGDGSGFALVRYSVAPRVLVSGRLRVTAQGPPFSLGGTVRVGGPGAAAGTLRVAGDRLLGTLGGRRVSGRL